MRKLWLLTLPLVLAGAAAAQPVNETPPTTTIQCIDVDGSTIPVKCDVPGSRIDQHEYICTCPAGGQRVEVAICGQGERQPAESVALNAARAQALHGNGNSLVGARFEGRRICVAPRNR
jgi:hypothetical protein